MRIEETGSTITDRSEMKLLCSTGHDEPEIRREAGPCTGVMSAVGLRAMLPILSIAVMVCMPAYVGSQSLNNSGDLSGTAVEPVAPRVEPPYLRPTQKTMIVNYAFDAYGPYPVAGAMFAAGINQLGNSPPEWRQGMEGYGRRFGSDFAIAAVGTTTRYGLAQAFREDTLYYRCECRGVLPRLSHAALSTLTSRRGVDGHRVFSIPALVAPYAGSMTAVYGWYPNRYGVKDGLRIGNYSLLSYMGGNIALEFLYSGPHSLLARLHLNNAHGSPVEGPKQ